MENLHSEESSEPIEQLRVEEKNIQEVFASNPELEEVAYKALGYSSPARIFIDGQEYINNPRIRFFKKIGDEIRSTLPKIEDEYVRLYRGNREGEVGQNPAFTNSLEGIALPFLTIYEGQLSYIDIKKEEAERFLKKGAVSPGNEFEVTPELASMAKVISNEIISKYKKIYPDMLVNELIYESNQLTYKQKKEAIQLYEKYLETIFPESKVKDILWHYSDNQFKDENFKPIKPNFDTLNSIEGVYNFSTNQKFVKRYGQHPYGVIVNIHNPHTITASGEFVDDMDRPLSEALYKIGKQKQSNILAPKYEESLKDTDAVINTITGEEYVEKHPVSGREMGLPKQTLITVFDPSQIHILGSSSDLQKFKEFVLKEK